MTEREYRQDDTSDGYCPQCGEPLSGLTVTGRGYCDRHGWTWADWTPKVSHVDAFYEYPIPPAVSDDDERTDDR